MRVLIIEDEADLVAQYKEVFVLHNHDVTTSLDGEEGISKYTKEFNQLSKISINYITS